MGARMRSPYVLSVVIAVTGGVLVGVIGDAAELSRGGMLLVAVPFMLAALAPVARDEVRRGRS
jgi:hypothetical protein